MIRYGVIEFGDFMDAIRKNWRNFVNCFFNLLRYSAIWEKLAANFQFRNLLLTPLFLA